MQAPPVISVLHKDKGECKQQHDWSERYTPRGTRVTHFKMLTIYIYHCLSPLYSQSISYAYYASFTIC